MAEDVMKRKEVLRAVYHCLDSLEVSLDEVRSTARSELLTDARQVLVWVLSQGMGLSFREVGDVLERHKANTYRAMKAVWENMKQDPELAWLVRRLMEELELDHGLGDLYGKCEECEAERHVRVIDACECEASAPAG